MELEVVKKKENLVVKLLNTDKLYVLNQHTLVSELNWYTAIEHKCLNLDISEIKYLDAAGIRFLLSLKKEYIRARKKLIITNINNEVRELLKLVGVGDMLGICEEREPAQSAA